MKFENRFWARVYKTWNCWFWIGGMNRGYGAMVPDTYSQNIPAHVFSYRMHKGEIPPGMLVMHTCDTPQCVNPDHLILGTSKDNAKDSANKGTVWMQLHADTRTTCRNGHDISQAGFYEYGGRRWCKVCKKITNQAAKRRMRMGKLSYSVAVLCLALTLAGCPQSTFHAATVAEHDFAVSVQSFQQAEMQEFQAGRIDAAEHQKLEAGIEKVGLAGQTLVTSLQAGAANTSVQQNFGTLSQAVNDLLSNGVIPVKNAQSQALIKAVLQTAQAILSNVSTLLAQSSTTGAK